MKFDGGRFLNPAPPAAMQVRTGKIIAHPLECADGMAVSPWKKGEK